MKVVLTGKLKYTADYPLHIDQRCEKSDERKIMTPSDFNAICTNPHHSSQNLTAGRVNKSENRCKNHPIHQSLPHIAAFHIRFSKTYPHPKPMRTSHMRRISTFQATTTSTTSI